MVKKFAGESLKFWNSVIPASLNLKPCKDQRRCLQQASELCYDQRMTFWSHILTATLLLMLGSSPAFSQASGNRLAAELMNLRQQQQQLEEDIEQYQKSIELLRSNRSREDGPSPALEALKAQLILGQTTLIELFEKEATLQQQLNTQRTTDPGYDTEAEEVARLKTLLNNYYADEALTAALAASDDASRILDRSDEGYAFDKVRLSGLEGVAAIQYMDNRLTEDHLSSPRRQLDIIFHIEVRRDGDLVSSSSHSLKSLGRSYYIGKVSLRGGIARVSVRKDEWAARLLLEQPSFYLVTLYLPREAAPELHLIPVEEMKATGWRELPAWLPHIGALPPAPAQS
jgi:hypothetical protein